MRCSSNGRVSCDRVTVRLPASDARLLMPSGRRMSANREAPPSATKRRSTRKYIYARGSVHGMHTHKYVPYFMHICSRSFFCSLPPSADGYLQSLGRPPPPAAGHAGFDPYLQLCNCACVACKAPRVGNTHTRRVRVAFLPPVGGLLLSGNWTKRGRPFSRKKWITTREAFAEFSGPHVSKRSARVSRFRGRGSAYSQTARGRMCLATGFFA